MTCACGSGGPILSGPGWFVVHSLWQGALVAVLTALVLAAMSRRSAAARYLVACTGLLAMLLLPAVTVVYTVVSGRQTLTADLVLAFGAIAGATSVGAVMQSVIPIVGVLWLTGTGISLLRSTLQWRRARQLVSRGVIKASAEIEQALAFHCRRMAVSRPVRVLQSTRATVPMVIGWLRPVILIPVTVVTGLSTEQLRAIIAHELAHVVRRDYLVNLVQVAIESVLFYHPGARWLSSRIRTEREYACDDLAIAEGHDTVEYSRALWALEELRSGQPPVIAPAATGAPLLERVVRLVDGTPVHYRLGRALSPLFIMLVLALAFLTAELAPPVQADALSSVQLQPRMRRPLAPGETPPSGGPARLRRPAPATATP